MPELPGNDLLREWRRVTDAIVASAASVTGHASDLPRQLLEQSQRQLELVERIVERERRWQRDFADRMLAPLDATFDLFEQSGAMLANQADALEAASGALQQTAELMRSQAVLFEQTVRTLREPLKLVKAAAGPEAPDREGT